VTGRRPGATRISPYASSRSRPAAVFIWTERPLVSRRTDTTSACPPDHAHFNGSVNLADADSVTREIAVRVPSGLRRIPDEETGDRGSWIVFQGVIPAGVRLRTLRPPAFQAA